MYTQSSLKIGLMGDVMIGRLVNDQLTYLKPDYIWGNVLSLLKENDLNIINLEAALTHSTEIVPKVFNFKAYPDRVSSLIEGHIHVVNLANNHILDFSEKGLLETLKTLDHAKIKHVGAGKNLQDAIAPVIMEVNQTRIGILGCTDNEPDWLASTSPGVFYLEVGDLTKLESSIKHLRQQVDLLILSMHWGPNMRERPPHHFIQFAHDLVDLGVDIIHGHSAHIFQGVEMYKGKIILYDSGDFIDDYAIDPYLRNDRSFLFLIECNNGQIKSLKLIPTVISNFQVNLSKGQEAQETIARMVYLSKAFHTSFTFHEDHLELII